MDTLEQLAGELGTLTWDYCVADQASSAVNKGYVTALMTPEHLHGGEASVYLCGPPPMVEAVRKHVDAGGVQPVGFYYERFALSGTGAAARVEVPDEPEVVAEAEAPTVAAPRSPSAHRQPSKSRPSSPARRAVRWPDRRYGPARSLRHCAVPPSRRHPSMTPHWPVRSPVRRSPGQEATFR